MRDENKLKYEGQKRLTGLRKENLCKKFRGKRQKIDCGTLPSRREKKSFEKLFEKVFESVKNSVLKNLIRNIRLIEKHIRSIESIRDS